MIKKDKKIKRINIENSKKTTNNLIIHFTSNIDKLESILQTRSLRISYSKEDFFIGNKKVSSAVHPMVCFSEYNINDLPSKKITYGRYGIGFSKAWAKTKKINSVIYINKDSMVARGLGSLLRARQNKEKSNLPDHLRLPIMQIKCFTKNEKGYNSYLKKDNFNFKLENEWRFVPEKRDIDNGLISQHKGRYLKKPKFYNDKLLKFPLRFKLSDIELIFVSHPSEVNLLSNKLYIEKNNITVATWF